MLIASGRHGQSSFFVLCAVGVLLPLVVADGWRVWPLLSIWIAGQGVRFYHDDRQLKTDYFTFGILYAWLARDELIHSAIKKWEEWKHVSGSIEKPYSAIGFAIPLAIIGLSLWRAYGSSNSTIADIPRDARRWRSEMEVPKARIFPCQTTHARIFPKRHAFAYSYLQCGFPIVPSGITCNENELPSGEDKQLGRWWLRIRAEDYLERGDGALGFYWKLKTYLRNQHVDDAEWSYAYLVTAPRFFGYSFNPVSFWYIYDHEHQLKKMILEVNNTFGERRMYLLDGSSPASPPQTPESQDSAESTAGFSNGARPMFTDLWMKDFHVSPFNSRKGSYALKALNPFPCVGHDPTLDNTITLKSSKDHGKLVARLFSTGKSLDPDQLGVFGTLKFILSWWWVGLVTFPRILREAFKLFTIRKLNVFFRPEVQTSSVGRLPTSDEVELHQVFSSYLHELVHQTEDPFRITFKSSIPGISTDIIERTGQPAGNQSTKCLEIRVLTPSFYSRLMHYAYTSEAIDRECVFTDERNRTLWMCRPQFLPALLSERASLHMREKNMPPAKRSYVDELRWSLLRKLRCPPAGPAYSVTPQNSATNIDDIRPRPYSELDRFVRSNMGRQYAGEYRRIVTKLFLAQRFCFGFSEIVGLLDSILRALFCYLAVVQIRGWSGSSAGMVSAECLKGLVTQKRWTDCVGVLSDHSRDWWWFASSAIAVFACHAYGLLKGYR